MLRPIIILLTLLFNSTVWANLPYAQYMDGNNVKQNITNHIFNIYSSRNNLYAVGRDSQGTSYVYIYSKLNNIFQRYTLPWDEHSATQAAVTDHCTKTSCIIYAGLYDSASMSSVLFEIEPNATDSYNVIKVQPGPDHQFPSTNNSYAFLYDPSNSLFTSGKTNGFYYRPFTDDLNSLGSHWSHNANRSTTAIGVVADKPGDPAYFFVGTTNGVIHTIYNNAGENIGFASISELEGQHVNISAFRVQGYGLYFGTTKGLAIGKKYQPDSDHPNQWIWNTANLLPDDNILSVFSTYDPQINKDYNLIFVGTAQHGVSLYKVPALQSETKDPIALIFDKSIDIDKPVTALGAIHQTLYVGTDSGLYIQKLN